VAHINKWTFTAAIPLLLSIGAVLSDAPILNILCFISHFIVLITVPHFKGRESLWMFLMTALSSIPFNIGLLIKMADYGAIFYPSLLPLSILSGALYYIILFSVEEVVMGIITRLIWKRQLKNIF